MHPHNFLWHELAQELPSGWVNKGKGLKQVLWERGFINPKLKYYAKIPDNWKNEDGEVLEEKKEDVKKFVLPEILANCEDFSAEITHLEDLCNQLSTSERQIQVLFSPKYHCELAGLGIEYAWGLAKRFYRRKIKFQDKKKDFGGSVDRALREITVDHCRKFLDRTRRYTMAYLWLDQNDVEHEQIERFVKVFKSHRSAMDQETAYFDKLIAEILRDKES